MAVVVEGLVSPGRDRFSGDRPDGLVCAIPFVACRQILAWIRCATRTADVSGADPADLLVAYRVFGVSYNHAFHAVGGKGDSEMARPWSGRGR